MIFLFWVFKFFLLTIICFFTLILLISYSKQKKQKKIDYIRNIFENQIINYAFYNIKENRENLCNIEFSKKQFGIYKNTFFNIVKVNPIFIEKAIDIINNLEGKIKKDLILTIEELEVTDVILKKYYKSRNNRDKEFYLYQIGELRSKKYLNFILDLNIKNVLEKGMFKGYFFALNSIINQWIHELPEEIVKKYIDKVFEVLEYIEMERSINIQKFLEIFLIDTSNFFKYLVTSDEIRTYFIKNLFEKKISLVYRGEIIYIVVLNHEYRVFDIVISESEKYFLKKSLDKNELDYLVFLVKAAGEIGIIEVFPLIKKACSSENWILKTIGAKYLYKYNTEESIEILYNMTFDSNWWVRYNAALSLEKIGYEGIPYLMKILTSEDKFAREIAAYVLTNGDFFLYVQKMLIEKEFDLVIQEILLIINTAGGINLLDKIIEDEFILETDKVKIIEKINTSKFIDYYENDIINKNVSEKILKTSKYIAKKISEGQK